MSFHKFKKKIICIKNIIIEGRVLYENNLLLELVSLLCTLLLNSYILCCLIRNSNVFERQLNYLEVVFFILSLSSFTGEAKTDIENEPLTKNKKLLQIYYFIQLIGILLSKLISLYIFSTLYHSDYQIPEVIRNQIFISYYFLLCNEFLICVVFSFNYISFYRQSTLSNLFMQILTLFILIYMTILISLNSSNYSSDFLKITFFEFSSHLIDSFSDKNRLWLVVSGILDFIITFLYNSVVYWIFNNIAKNSLSNKVQKNNFINNKA